MKTTLNHANKLDKIVAKAYLSSFAIAGLLYDLSPILKDLWYCELLGAECSYDLPMKSAYFYDVTKSPWYEISYAIFFVESFVIVFTTVSTKKFDKI
jgi:hypothetical protein